MAKLYGEKKVGRVLRGDLNVAALERPRHLEAEEGSVRLGRACKLTKTFIRERLNDMMTPSSLERQHHHQAVITEDINIIVSLIKAESCKKVSDCNETLCERGWRRYSLPNEKPLGECIPPD